MTYSSSNAIHETVTPAEGMTVTEFAAALGLAAAQPEKAPQRTEPTVEWHNRLRDMHEADRARQAPQWPTPVAPAPRPRRSGVTAESVKQIVETEVAKDIHRAEQSFVWREPVTAEEWVNGADGMYHSAFQQG